MFKTPTEPDIFAFTVATHAMDRINLPFDVAQNTWKQKGMPNPYAQGHFRAFMYITHQLINTTDFPAKDVELIKNLQDSYTALYWLRDIHHKMTDPLVGHFSLMDDPNAPTSWQVGMWRVNPAMASMHPAPPPDLIPRLMHNWLVDYASFHNKIKDKLENPYGFSQNEAYDICEKAYEINLFFCAVQPLACLNQRMGRFLENTFRLAWRLPMKYKTPSEQEFLPTHIDQFSKDKLPKLVIAATNVRA